MWVFIMDKVIDAVYENGVFRPLEKVDLPEGARVRLLVKRSVVDRTKGVLKGVNMNEIIEEIENESVL